MRVGIVGSGQIAKIHGPLILKQPDTEIVGVVDQDLTRAKVLAAELRASGIYQDAQTMLDREKPDVVHVLTPPQSHSELSIMAMNRGCHVLVEKPMALTVGDAEKMINVAKQNNVYLCANHNMIFQDVVQRATALISADIIGEPVSVEAHYAYDVRRYPTVLEAGAEHCHWTYKLNGGPLQDHMPHPASLVVEFLPDVEVEEVHCAHRNRGLLPGGWPDEVRVLIQSDNVLGYVSVSLNEKPDTISLTVRGTKGMVQADLFNGILTLRRESDLLPRAVVRGLSGFRLAYQYFRESLGNTYRFAAGQVDKSNGIEPVISRFYQSIRTGSATPIPPETSLRVVELTNRIWPTPVANTREKRRFSSPFLKAKRATPTALVTGASGFIGTHLVAKLVSENIGIRALVRPNTVHAGRLRKFDIEIEEGDLANPKTLCGCMRGIKTVYHAGAVLSGSWEELYQTNVKGTKYLIEAALAYRVERFVHLSTLAVYDVANAEDNAIIREDSPYHKNPRQMGPYAYSKIESEKSVFNAYRRHDLGVTVVRPGIVIGPLGRVFFPHLGYRYKDKLFLLIDDGDNVLPLTYAENTVDGIYRASVEDKAIGQVYNLVDDGAITARQYLEHFMEITGVQPRIIYLPYALPYFACTAYEAASRLGLVKQGITSRAQFNGKHKPVYFDNTKAKQELNWQPSVPIQEGLTRTFKWYADQQ